MIGKTMKYGIVAVVCGALVMGVLFGKEAISYVSTAARTVQTAAEDSVPIEFQLKRASDMLEDIIPEMHANIRLIAQEEVEIANLKEGIGQGKERIDEEHARIAKLRDMMGTQQVVFTMGGIDYSRLQVKEELARRFDRFKEAEVMLASKCRLVAARESSLKSAMKMLEKTRSEKSHLENQVAAMESQYRLIKTASTGSRFQVDHSKIAQADKLLKQIRNRLDVAERVLAHEARFTQPIEIDVIEEVDLLEQIDTHFTSASQANADTSDDGVLLSQGDKAPAATE